MLFKKQKLDWLLVPLLATGLFTYASYQPRHRLRPDMPSEFLDLPSAGSLSQPDAEEKVARAYWSCLVHDIQWKYGYEYNLPSDPPAEFTLANAAGLIPQDTATRIRYWRKAQHVWYLSSAWQRDYEWDFHWTSSIIQTGGDWLRRQFQHLGGD
jgi:hypothetical protein